MFPSQSVENTILDDKGFLHPFIFKITFQF